MPPQDEDKKDLQNSQQPDGQQPTVDGAANTDASAASGNPDGQKPAGEAGSDGKKVDDAPKSALDAVLKVLDKKADGAAAAASDGAAAEKKDGTQAGAPAADATTDEEHKKAGEGEKDWISKEDYAKLPPAVRRRFGTLTSQRNEARDQAKAFQPKAQVFDELQTYCKQSGLSAEDFNYGLEIMRLVRNDPVKAWEALQPVIKELQGHVGEILPADLAKEVEDGSITDSRAKELAAARRAAQRLNGQSEERARADREAQEQRSVTETVQKVTLAITGWENQWKGSDPDYPKKAKRVWAEMRVLMDAKQSETGRLLTADEAVAIAKEAKKNVEDWLAELLPKKEEKRPLNPTGSNAGTNRKPSSALEAAQMAVSASR
jgi:hypothetical protein